MGSAYYTYIHFQQTFHIVACEDSWQEIYLDVTLNITQYLTYAGVFYP